jgi:YgiT-type zinc finger domain-containing protein
MKCVICKHGETHPGEVTVTLPKNEATLIFKLVPAEVCENCGEYYLSEETTTKLMDQARQALKEGTEVEIKRFAA